MRRRPWLTTATLAVTAAVNLVQLVEPRTLARLERTAAVRHGEPWRLLTSLLVQDGGAFGALLNLLGLAVLGVLAEQVLSRPSWLTVYLGAGVTGEIAGVWWQPTGGGNSVAVCGLAAVTAVAAWRGRTSDPPLTRVVSVATLVWVVLMLTSAWSVVFVPGVVVAVVVGVLVRGRAAVAVPAAVTAIALTLAAVGNIHGAALLAGLVLASALAATGRLAAREAVTEPSSNQCAGTAGSWQADRHERRRDP